MERNIYDRKSVHSLILYFSIPAIFSLIVEIMASVVDTVFAGHLGEISIDALTAMGLLSPILGIYTAVQALFAVSTAIMIARYLTCKEVRTEYFLTGLGMTLVLSVMVSIGSFLFMPGLLSLLGAEGQAAIFAEKYLRIQLFSNVFSALGYTLTSCIRAFGYPAMEMGITSLSVVVNIVFNAILVFVFDWGFVGLACGTFVSELFCCALSILWLKHHQFLELKCALSWGKFKSHTAELLKLGIAQTIIQSLGGCATFCVNQSLMLYTTMSHEVYEKAVERIADEIEIATRKEDIKLVEDSKKWVLSPERKASKREKQYALDRLDGVIKKIEYAITKTISKMKNRLLKPENKNIMVQEIKKEVKPSILKKLSEKKASITRNGETGKLNKESSLDNER